MKKALQCSVLLLLCVSLLWMDTACAEKTQVESTTADATKTCYRQDDFDTVVAGKSTFADVYGIAPSEVMQVTAYGGLCEYPLQDGGAMRIKFYGSQLLVGEVERIP